MLLVLVLRRLLPLLLRLLLLLLSKSKVHLLLLRDRSLDPRREEDDEDVDEEGVCEVGEEEDAGGASRESPDLTRLYLAERADGEEGEASEEEGCFRLRGSVFGRRYSSTPVDNSRSGGAKK